MICVLCAIMFVFSVQLVVASQQVHSLQQQLKENASQGAHGLDVARLQTKVEGLQFDLGNLTQSLQVAHPKPLSSAAVIVPLQPQAVLCMLCHRHRCRNNV